MPRELSVHSIISDPEQLLALEPEELAAVILEVLNSLREEYTGQLNRRDFTSGNQPIPYPQEYRERISKALTEAQVWLEREVLIAPRPGEQADWVFVTRRAAAVADRCGRTYVALQGRILFLIRCYKLRRVAQPRLHHPVILGKLGRGGLLQRPIVLYQSLPPAAGDTEANCSFTC